LGEQLKVNILDHIIVGAKSSLSLKAEGFF